MRINTNDQTLKRNYINTYQHYVAEYELIKAQKHSKYRFVKDFYKDNNICHQTFLKYYGRYKNGNMDINAFLPGKRGPKFKGRREPTEIEKEVLKYRDKGCNKYEISSILKNIFKHKAPSQTTIYNILKKYGKNKLHKKAKEEKRRIIKNKLGELGHIDCHHLARGTISNDNKKYYLVCVVDGCSRVAWVEVVEDIKALTVMFATLRCFNQIINNYEFRFEEVLTDNGPEFGHKDSKRKDNHPFERMCKEMGIKHRHTMPYRPQTNGKVERFWRTLNEDLVEGTYFESIDHFKDELFDFLVYYNELRPHQGINGVTPSKHVKKVATN